MKATVRKTTLGEYNRGICGNANNCRYTGGSACYSVDTDSTYIDVAGRRQMLPLAAFNARWAAEGLAAWANRTEYNGAGDPVMMWASEWATDPSARRWMDTDSAKEV